MDTAQSSTITAVKPILEGLVFASGEEGLSLVQIQSVLQSLSRDQIEESLQQLQQEYAKKEHGIELVYYSRRWKFVTKEIVYDFGKKLYEQIVPASLSPAALETLAIIAYKQPITRVEIEAIRGVSCDAILKKLLQRDLIQAAERSDAVGKPLLYSVTDAFLDSFSLESLEELPPIQKDSVDPLFSSAQDPAPLSD